MRQGGDQNAQAENTEHKKQGDEEHHQNRRKNPARTEGEDARSTQDQQADKDRQCEGSKKDQKAANDLGQDDAAPRRRIGKHQSERSHFPFTRDTAEREDKRQ